MFNLRNDHVTCTILGSRAKAKSAPRAELYLFVE